MLELAPGTMSPTDTIGLWRYQDISKFIALLSKSALFLPRAVDLGDAWEGATTELDTVVREIALRDFAKGTPYVRESDLRRWDSKVIRRLRKEVCVSSWHASDRESAAMWRIYCTSSDAVAIHSTIDRMRKAFSTLPELAYYGMVEYVEYATADIHEEHFSFSRFFRKRLSFQHEAEFRLVASTGRVNEYADVDTTHFLDPRRVSRARGAYLAVDPAVLIDSVYVAPTAPRWFRDVVIATCKAFRLTVPVHHSRLDDEPLF